MENLKKFNQFKKQNESNHLEYEKIMDIGYDEWIKHDDWSYTDMIEWVKQKYGEDYSFLILFGKLNQQVGNGGFIQYWDNGYASKQHSDTKLHNEIISYLQDNMLDIPHRAKLLHILNEFNNVVDDVGDECPDCGGAGEYYDDYDDEYCNCHECDGDGKISLNSYSTNYLDNEYYKIDDEILDYLEKQAKKILSAQ